MSLSWVMSCFCGLQEKNHVCGVLFFSNMVLFFNKQFQNRKKCLHNFRLSIIELCVHNSRMDNQNYVSICMVPDFTFQNHANIISE